MNKILVIGGAGFLGLHLSEHLIKLGYKVDIIDNFSRGKKDIFLNKLIKSKNINIINHDLSRNLKKNISKDYSYIYQFAAILGVKKVIQGPSEVLVNNVKIQINSIQIAKEQKKLKKFIFSSTSEVHIGSQKNLKMKFPTSENFPILLDDLKHPRTSYSLSKIYCEVLCMFSGLDYIIIRPHNLYGERMGNEHVIPQLLKKINKKKNRDFIELKSATHKRCFCYIEDAIKQIYKLTISSKANNETFNIGNNSEEISINNLLNQMLVLFNKKSIKKIIITDNDGSPNRRVPDMSKTIKITKTTKYTKLKKGLLITKKWYEKHNLLK